MKVPVPDFQSLMLPVLKATASGPISAAELRDRVATLVGLTEDDLAELLPSGRQTTFANRTAWANIFLQRGGLIERVGRGVYRASPKGMKVLEQSPSRIDMKFLESFPSYVEWRSRNLRANVSPIEAGPQGDAATSTPEEEIEQSYRTLTAALEVDVLDRLREMSPAFFENLIVDLLVAMGYGGGRRDMGQAIGRSGDGGIDGIIKEDALGLDVVYMQAKRYRPENTVGRPEVQGFAGSLDGVRATKGIFLTTSSFSSGARDFAERINKRIILIDGVTLARLMVQHSVGVRVRQVYEIKRVDEDYFSE